jgi:hypothetical protein
MLRGIGLGAVITEVLYKRMIYMCVFIGEVAWVERAWG